MSTENELWAEQSPWGCSEYEQLAFDMTYENCSGVIIAGAVMEIYKNGTGADIPAMQSGAFAANGNNLTWPVITMPLGAGGNDYIVSVRAVVDGRIRVTKLKLTCQKLKAR